MQLWTQKLNAFKFIFFFLRFFSISGLFYKFIIRSMIIFILQLFLSLDLWTLVHFSFATFVWLICLGLRSSPSRRCSISSWIIWDPLLWLCDSTFSWNCSFACPIFTCSNFRFLFLLFHFFILPSLIHPVNILWFWEFLTLWCCSRKSRSSWNILWHELRSKSTFFNTILFLHFLLFL